MSTAIAGAALDAVKVEAVKMKVGRCRSVGLSVGRTFSGTFSRIFRSDHEYPG